MYTFGTLISFCFFFNQKEYGDQIWKEACRIVECKHNSFKTHQIYPDHLMPDFAAALSASTGESFDFFMNFFGKCFVRFFSNFGYDKMIRATGRFFCDFLQSIDNIHLQMRFTYPKMKSPSMQLTHMDDDGAMIVYRSGRTGMSKYLIGQMTEVARQFYGLKIRAYIAESQNDIPGGTAGPIKLTDSPLTVIVKYRLDFDNKDYMATRINVMAHSSQLNLPAVNMNTFLDLFPFTLVLDHNMAITQAGEKVIETLILHNPGKNPKSFIGSNIMKHFRCRRPKGTIFEWDVIIQMRTVLFELELMRTGRNCGYIQVASMNSETVNYDELSFNEACNNVYAGAASAEVEERESDSIDPSSGERIISQGLKSILLKGQMFFIKDIDSLIFLCSPFFAELATEQIKVLYGKVRNEIKIIKKQPIKIFHVNPPITKSILNSTINAEIKKHMQSTSTKKQNNPNRKASSAAHSAQCTTHK